MGAGRLQIATAAPVAPIVAVAVPEALVMPIPVDDVGGLRQPLADDLLDRIADADALLIGPGMPSSPSPVEALEATLARAGDSAVIVLDAAALACLPHVSAPLRERHAGRMILTPNRQEARRLGEALDQEESDLDETGQLAWLARRCGAVVTSFGAVRAADGRAWDGPPGHPSLGTSGSGDVLAGLALGAAGRARDAAQAACWATFVHAMTGARLAEERGELGFLARELIDHARV
jgi:NAD(P)H-hydrate repair Nnr-like enzyme with NAD(P)H-hydrate dehydratase domain